MKSINYIFAIFDKKMNSLDYQKINHIFEEFWRGERDYQAIFNESN